MAGLISDQLINNLRTVAYKQLITPVQVWRDVKSEGPYGTKTVSTLVGTPFCWFKPNYKGNLVIQPGGNIANDSGAEFRFSHGTDVQVGDRLTVEGQDNYVVQDVNVGATIQLYLKAWAERTE